MKMVERLKSLASPAENPYAFLASLSRRARGLYSADLYERWLWKVGGTVSSPKQGKGTQPT